MPATQKMLDATPDMTLTRTGVPSFLLNTPKNGKNEPSYDATAWMRSEPIIQTAPEVTSAPMKHRVITIRRPCAAPPYAPWNVSDTASMKPPIEVTALAGSTSRMQKIGITYMSTPVIPEISTEIGTSRWGSSISSA